MQTATIHDQITLTTKTNVKVNKTIKVIDTEATTEAKTVYKRIPNPIANSVVEKHNKGAKVIIFQNVFGSGYNNMVQRRLEKEGKNPESFKLGARVWGNRLKGSPIVEHKGNDYLELIFIQSGESSYTVDGKPVSLDSIAANLPPKAAGGKQGGLNDKVIIRTFKVESIQTLTIGNNTYTNSDLMA